MSNATTLVACASWEDRFRLGVERDIEVFRPRSLVVYFFQEFENWTADNRRNIAEHCRAKGVDVVERRLSFARPAENWKQLQSDCTDIVAASAAAHVDISTMPRELIWTAFWSLQMRQITVSYTYHTPAKYNDGWLSRDPGRPRLVFKLSGIAKLGRRTALVVLTGFDDKRTSELMRFYEPERTLIGLQQGDLNTGNAAKMNEQRLVFGRDAAVLLFDIDAYSSDHGEQVLTERLRPLLASHNVVVSSLGPKLSAVAIYRIQRRFPEIGVSYAPSCEFNRDYSQGIGTSYRGSL